MTDLVFVADVHLVEGDEEAPVFMSFLRSLAGNTSHCIIVGDLFNVWIARRRFMSPGQMQLLAVLRDVAASGVRFTYVEGNRDYFVGENWSGDTFSQVAGGSMTATAGPTRLLVTHGDQVNKADIPYRFWRALSRSLPVRALLSLLTGAAGRRLADSLEGRLRGTNLRHKADLPMAHLEALTRQAAADGCQGVVLGHFHTEVQRQVGAGTLWILPDWRSGRRYLRFGQDGRGRFVRYDEVAP